jgi:hypothetical protein
LCHRLCHPAQENKPVRDHSRLNQRSFNTFTLSRLRISDEFAQRRTPDESGTASSSLAKWETVASKPWLAASDQVLEIHPPDRLLRYLYVFSNPFDGLGFPRLNAVQDAVVRSLDQAAALRAQRIAMIQIPFTPEGRKQTREQHIESVTAAIAALRRWDHTHSGKITDVYLVDLDDDFGPLILAK